METSDLLKLIDAVETGDKRYYHCDIREGVVEGLKELVQLREQVEEVKDILK